MLKEIIIELPREQIGLAGLSVCQPIFAKRDGKLQGMIVKERDKWILRLGGESASNGWHRSLRECIESNLKYDYTFFVED